jgi:short-subunit dehydrogenase
MSFAKQVVLITGAANGIGRELACQLAAEGAAIAAIDQEAEALTALEKELAGKPFAGTVADVMERDALSQAVADLEKRLGPVDLLIASAGIGRQTSALTYSAADIEAHIRVNLIGVSNSVGAVLPGMLKRRKGHLAVLSSLASFRGLPGMAGYCASKAGVSALFDSLRVELAPQGIAVTTICPGWIRTRMTAHVAARIPKPLEVADAGRRIIAALRQRRPFVAFPAGDAFRVRLLRWLPTRLSDWIVARQFRRMQR